MESDLSLLEISGEDDSLLLELPNDDASKLNSNNYFLCSPLQIHGSKPPRPLLSAIAKGKVGNVDTEKPSPSLQTDSISKENINANKVEMPKLNMEPQQMKRKKKGGGYNLRKSLAWDRAFFTEEGVLNPSELSMICGSFSKVGGGMLPIIPEEGRESLSGASDVTHNAADLQSLEVDLFKELPTSVKKDGKSGSRLLPKHGSPARDNVAPASAAKRKVLATNDVNRSGSKRGGCPRPVAASSLKRPANVHTTKAETKASKVSKIPVSKLDSCVFSRTTKGATSGANDSRRNLIAQTVNIQRKAGPKASSDSTKIVQNNPKSGPATKSLTAGTSVRQARRKVVISSSEKHPSTNLQHPPVTVANNSSEIIPDTLLPSTSHTPDSHDGGGNKVAVTLPQNACITGGQIQHAQLQKAKPSGLRLPSPSLGFFGQPKASLHSPLQRTSRPYNLPVSNTSNLRKPGATNHIHDLRPPLHPGKIPNVTTIGNMKVLGSSLGCSVPSTVNPASHNKQDEKMKSVLQMNDRQVEVKVPYDNKCYGAIKNQNQLDSILDDINQQVLESAEPFKTEVIAHREESELQRAYCGQLEKSDDNNKVADVCLRNRDLSGTELENPPSISSLSFVVQDNGVSETKDLIDHQSVEDKPYSLATKNDGAFPGSNSGYVSGSSTTNISKANDDWLSSAHDVRKQSELMKPSTCEDGKISSESQRLWAKNGSFLKDNGASKEFLKFNCLADVSPKIQGCSEIALRSSHGQACYVYMEQAKDDAGKDDKMSSNSLVGDAQAQSLEGHMLDAIVKSSLSTSTVDSQYFMVVDDVNERIGEQLELCQTVESAILEANGACECKSNSSNTHCLVSSAMQDCSCGVAKTMACQQVKGAPSGSVNKPVVENYESSIDTQFRHNVELHGQFSPSEMEMEMEMRGEDHMTGTGPKSGDFSWNELESRHPACRLSPTVQVNGGSGIDDVIQLEDVEEKKYNLLTKISSGTSESRPGDDIGDSHCDTSIVPIDLPSDMHIVNEHFVEQTKLSMLCPVEADYEENQSPETCSLSSAKSQSSEGSMRFNIRTAADNSKVKISGESGYVTGTGCPKSGDFSGNELENPHPACCLSPTVQVNDGSGIDDVIQQGVEEKKCNLLIKIPSATSESQPGDDIGGSIGGSHCDTSTVPIDLLSDMHVVNEHSVEQTKLSMLCPVEADYEENHSPETYHSLLSAKSQSSEGSLRFNSRTAADNSKVKSSGGSGCMTGTGCPKSGDFSGNELENPYPARHLSPSVQVNGVFGIDDVTQQEDVEEKKYNLLIKIPSATSESQPGDDIGGSHCDTSIVPIDLLSDMHVVNEHSVEQTKLSMLCPVEADYEENHSPETYHSLLSAKSQSSEGSLRFNSRTVADNSKLKSSGGSGCMTGTGCPKSGDFSGNELENPHPAHHLSPSVQVNGGFGIDDVTQQEDVEEKKCNLLIKIPSVTSESQPGDDIGGCHCDTSIVPIDLLRDMHVVNEHSLQQTELSMPCSVEADYEENQSSETYHSLLFAKSQSSEGSMRFNSRTDADSSEAKGSGRSGLESPHIGQRSKEVDGFNDMYKESNLVQSSNGKILVGSFNSNVNISAASNQYPMVVDDLNDQSGHPELQNSILIVEQVLLDNNHGLCLNEDFLLANTTSEELKKESAMAGYDVYGSKSESSMLFSEATPALQEDGVDADQKAEHLHMEDTVTGSVNIVPLAENLEYCTDSKFRHNNGLSDQASLKFDSSAKMSTDQISGAVRTYNSKGFFSWSEESGLSILTDQSSESHNVLKRGSLSGEAETDISQICEMQQESDGVVHATDDKDTTMQPRNPEDDNLENDKKQDARVIKPPPHAAPFSDEWLAAFESAGEEILTMKSGAVQHSPPDKSQPEPGPWSPVRRKNNQEIGPFDCTKCTNIPPSSSQ